MSRVGHHKQILRSSGKLKLPGAPFAVFVLLRPVMALDLAGGERVGTGDRPQELGSFHSAGSWSRARPHSAAAVAGRCIDCRSGPAKPLNFIPAVEASAEGGTLAQFGPVLRRRVARGCVWTARTLQANAGRSRAFLVKNRSSDHWRTPRQSLHGHDHLPASIRDTDTGDRDVALSRSHGLSARRGEPFAN